MVDDSGALPGRPAFILLCFFAFSGSASIQRQWHFVPLFVLLVDQHSSIAEQRQCALVESFSRGFCCAGNLRACSWIHRIFLIYLSEALSLPHNCKLT